MRILTSLFICCCCLLAKGQNPDSLKLSEYKPVSIYKIPVSHIVHAKYPVIDFHAHDDEDTDASLEARVKRMDSAGIEKAIILTYSTGARFDSLIEKYAPFSNRFELWCGFDYGEKNKPGWEKRAIAELERCYAKGARGVGELGDKGLGELYSLPYPGYGIHIDDPAMKPLLTRCGELKMPVSIHVAEDQWMYENQDATNDGLMNAYTWKVDMQVKGKLGHDELIHTLEQAVKENPHTIFIACHLANSNANLGVLGRLFDTYPNLYADIAARYGEFAPIPRVAKSFFEKYADRIVYGTDMGTESAMYQATFRILESADDHFYLPRFFNYHWPLYGLSLSEATLEKIYHQNGVRILTR